MSMVGISGVNVNLLPPSLSVLSQRRPARRVVHAEERQVVLDAVLPA